ncbi:MAG: cyclase family protein, partial [Bdellovibrionota bacterium]
MRPRELWDISPRISLRTGVFPGDRPFHRHVAFSFSPTHRFELSSIETTVHIGAHADAPRHYHPEGASIDRVPLALYVGRCQVVTALRSAAGRILP